MQVSRQKVSISSKTGRSPIDEETKLKLFSCLEEWNRIRRVKGKELIEGLMNDEALILPQIIDGANPVFNHVPLVFRDCARMERIQKRLWNEGIDTGRMYEHPINHIYDWLGYGRDPEPFPNAAFIAPRLLTLPSHPYLDEKSITKIIRTFKTVS